MIWLPADHRQLGDGEVKSPALVLSEKYAHAVKQGALAQPVLFPLAEVQQIPDLLTMVHGVLLTGSPSNVHPSHFDEDVADTSLPLDAQRDQLTLALVKACVQNSVPLLGICRGFQEINVALGGSLHQQVHRQAGMMDHREPVAVSLAQQFAPRHEVRFVPGSKFAQWAGASSAIVNSLHGQGIKQLASGLRAAGVATDGLIEAFEVEGAHAFACAVQWHPEWHFWENPFYSAIFTAFGEACRQRQQHMMKDREPVTKETYEY
jgi:putative glutamine amidotransferase